MCQRASYGYGVREFCDRGHLGPHGIAEREHPNRDCCCHHVHGLGHFPTREEKIARMEEYLRQLQAEAKGVEERLSELRKQAG
jgi:hypothetical protein